MKIELFRVNEILEQVLKRSVIRNEEAIAILDKLPNVTYYTQGHGKGGRVLVDAHNEFALRMESFSFLKTERSRKPRLTIDIEEVGKPEEVLKLGEAPMRVIPMENPPKVIEVSEVTREEFDRLAGRVMDLENIVLERMIEKHQVTRAEPKLELKPLPAPKPPVVLKKIMVVGGDNRLWSRGWFDNLPPCNIIHEESGGANWNRSFTAKKLAQADFAFVLTEWVGHTAENALKKANIPFRRIGRASARDTLRAMIVDYLEGRLK